MEGVGCFLTGLLGPGVGVTSYSENIAAIGLTKVNSHTKYYLINRANKSKFPYQVL